jgi:type I restriction enzyme, R subunit
MFRSGWTPLRPDVARQKRGGEAGTLLRDELEDRLAEFNPWLAEDAIRSIIETLDAIPATIEGNRDMLSWLRGARSWYDENE